MQYVSDRRLREYTLDELGRFQLITDVIGGFSYTTDLTFFMQRVMGLLQVNGSFLGATATVDSRRAWIASRAMSSSRSFGRRRSAGN